jgi:leucyl/phenylalanyl-tRNA---protein transferase
MEAGAAFFDVQLPTPHLESLGVLSIQRPLFLELLTECREDDIRLCTDELPVARIPSEYVTRVAALQASV